MYEGENVLKPDIAAPGCALQRLSREADISLLAELLLLLLL